MMGVSDDDDGVSSGEASPRAPPPPPLISDVRCLWSTLVRLHATNDAVVFWNRDRSFKIMLRNDPEDAVTLACDLSIVFDEEDPAMGRVMDLMFDGYLEEAGIYVLESWKFSREECAPEDVTPVLNAINRVHDYSLCPCGSYVIKDRAPMCAFCHLTSTVDDAADEGMCAICHDACLARHAVHMGCCNQMLHGRCLRTWKSTSEDPRCPLCRQPPM